MDYTPLPLEDFGHYLFDTNDLDPIYVMLTDTEVPEGFLKKWTLAYWCFYHAGTACLIAESDDFYDSMRQAVIDTWPKGSERRYFMGKDALKAVDCLESLYPSPADSINFMLSADTFQDVKSKTEDWFLFGPWITFKIADMIDRVYGENIDFSDCRLDIYSEPVKGANLYKSDWSLDQVVDHLIDYYSDVEAPPFYDRKANVQEIETVLCKWKSHKKGHYPPGNDIIEVRHHLDWGINQGSQWSGSFLDSMPPVPATPDNILFNATGTNLFEG